MLVPGSSQINRLIMVTFELNSYYKDYTSLENLLQSAFGSIKIMENTWLLYTQRNVDFWNFNLGKLVTNKDKFIITDITDSPKSGNLSQRAWDWINTVLYKSPEEKIKELKDIGY